MTKLHPKSLGIALGAVMAISLFAITAILLIPGGGQGNTFGKLGHIYFGYNPQEVSGLIIGPIYAFINGYVLGWLIAVFYNKSLDAEMLASGEDAQPSAPAASKND
ncbi:MAG: hypothetical protein Kow0059_08580 [Candidatus Sumerlaeia bacterium]